MSSIVHTALPYYSDNDTRYVFLEGSRCGKIADCFTSLQQQLSIPAYFGKNLDALEEVLDDLDWIEEKRIKIIVFNLPALLQQDHSKKEGFLEILHAAANDKIEIIYLGSAGAVAG